jgi:hypothetical protein
LTNSSEITNPKGGGSKSLLLWVFTGLVLLILTYLVYYKHSETSRLEAELVSLRNESKQDIESIRAELLQSNQSNGKLRRTGDSLQARLNLAEPYFPTIGMLRFRDSAHAQLAYAVGELVMLKPDSAKGVISDIIMEGSNQSFSIRYKVITRDRKEWLLDEKQLWKINTP